jgi:hypothetical protein
MPCHRCGARQGDPVRGPSPWKRGVVAGEQVLICPACQGGDSWQEGLDRCPSCESVRLSKTLGTVRCGQCGWSGETGAESTAPAAESADARLAADVQAALSRRFSEGLPGAR